MSENPARSQGLFHSGGNYLSWKIFLKLPQLGCCGRPLQVHPGTRAHAEQGVRDEGGEGGVPGGRLGEEVARLQGGPVGPDNMHPQLGKLHSRTVCDNEKKHNLVITVINCLLHHTIQDS